MKKKFQSIEPYIWILPSVLLMAIFIVIPIGFVFRMSFSKISKAGLIKGFCGFDNFHKVLNSPVFSMVLKNTVVWTVAVVGLSTLLGFILAIILNNNFKGRKIARAVVVFPWATTLIVQASIWKFIIDTDYGTLNTLLMRLGIIDHAINWTPTAGAYFAWEIACGIFVTIPFVTFTVLSGLQSIDEGFYEAATVDGADRFQKMWHITVPGLLPTFMVMLLMAIAGILSNGMDQYMVFDNPNNTNVNMVLDYYVYKLGIMDGNIPFATMVGMVKSVVSVVLLFAANGVSKLLRGESIV